MVVEHGFDCSARLPDDVLLEVLVLLVPWVVVLEVVSCQRAAWCLDLVVVEVDLEVVESNVEVDVVPEVERLLEDDV